MQTISIAPIQHLLRRHRTRIAYEPAQVTQTTRSDQLRLTTVWRFSVEFLSQNGDNLVGLTVLGLALPSIVVISLGSFHAWSHFLRSGSIIDLLTSSKSVLLEVLLSLSVGCLSLVQTRVALVT